MKIRIVAAALLATSIATPVMADVDPNVAEARQVIKQFFTQLKGELKKAMKEGGPVHAISVCNEKAPKIADDISAKTGWYVARTSLKPRAPTNSPLPWEKKVLQKFEAEKAAGKPVKAIDYSDVVEEDGKKVFRYMKAIPTGAIPPTRRAVSSWATSAAPSFSRRPCKGHLEKFEMPVRDREVSPAIFEVPSSLLVPHPEMPALLHIPAHSPARQPSSHQRLC